MTPEQQRKTLECAAKACGLSVKPMEIKNVTEQGDDRFIGLLADDWPRGWFNPLANPADTAEMCAKICINTTYWWGSKEVECQCFFVKEFTEFFSHRVKEADHDNSRLKAWMFAATMCAAKIGGYTE